MEISGVKDGEVMVFQISGRLDAQTAPTAEAEVKNWLGQGENKLIGDLSNLDYISSAGLRILLMAAKSLKGCGGALCLFGLKDAVREVFEMAGFTSVIPLAGDKGEATAKVSG